jgi:hypothetical protein
MTNLIPSLKPSDVLRMDALVSLALIDEKLSRMPASGSGSGKAGDGHRVISHPGGKLEHHYTGPAALDAMRGFMQRPKPKGA